jgi:KaiC/GvpD/RAD55 family RecA-like ATPase
MGRKKQLPPAKETQEARRSVFRFGIPSLDLLLGRNTSADNPIKVADFGIGLPVADQPTSMSLIGPDGSGKSVLALHLASRYFADNDDRARVIYVSTDLSYSRAQQVWSNFALDRATQRLVPFAWDYELADPEKEDFWTYKEGRDAGALKWYSPEPSGASGDTSAPVEKFLVGDNSQGIAFVDLATASAGDDWAFLCRLVATLESGEKGAPRHLLIVDAIEGFEVFDEDSDRYGQKLSRRGRISQIMRLAAGKCHVVLVVEESRTDERGPEEFVTDSVIRFRHSMVRSYSRRTIEVEKVRGQSNIRGEHPYTIRKGEGSSTGYQPNDDDPVVALDSGTQSYVQVFPSLHCQSREFMKQRLATGAVYFSERLRDPIHADFGIRFLDDLLVTTETTVQNELVRTSGLPFGKVTAVVGDPHTHKGRLASAFLAAEFRDFLQTIKQSWPRKTLPQTKCGACVMITSRDISNDQLAQDMVASFLKQAGTVGQDLEQHLTASLAERIVCRRLEIHDIPGPILMHIVAQTITGARRRVLGKGNSNRIRVVFDDFSTFTEIYPDIRNESLFLPALLFRLRRAAAATLIIDTSAGRPDSILEDRFENELRALVDYRLYTWRVPFFGESRIAIAPIPPLAVPASRGEELSAVIRELRWTGELAPPQVDPHFEMYRGLEEGHPEPVPLQVRLYCETPAFERYIAEENAVWNELFKSADGQSVLVGVPVNQYDALHDFSVLQQETRLDHTLVLQIDDFWSFRRQDSLRDRREYLLKEVTHRGGQRDPLVDPFGVFQPAAALASKVTRESGRLAADGARPEPSRTEYHRGNGFRPVGYKLDDKSGQIDRIPFVWDFGFLLCHRPAWEASSTLPCWGTQPVTVGMVWEGMRKAYGQNPELRPEPAPLRRSELRPSWREFLGAASVVARAHPDAVPFDLAAGSSESFCCLVMEIWFSEIIKNLTRAGAAREKELQDIRAKGAKNWNAPGFGLDDAIRMYPLELYRAWLLLIDALQLDRFTKSSDPFGIITGQPDLRAVAARHWYKTACARDGSMSDVVAVALPGHCSVRGDWFLAVAGTSRSARLADRACDLLSSRRGNFHRLQSGMGLPVRDIVRDPEHDDAQIRTALRLSSSTGASGNVVYKDLCSLGADAEGFQWLWRSEFKDYDLHSRLWQKWLLRTCIAWSDRRAFRDKYPWTGGFTIYDHLAEFDITGRVSQGGNPGSDWSWTLDAGSEKRMTEWKKRYPVSRLQFVETWELFQKLCKTFIRLASHASAGANSTDPFDHMY